MALSYEYHIAPLSATVFSILQVMPPVIGQAAQEVDISHLPEAELHKVLHLFKKKIDRDALGRAAEYWRRLPDIQSDKFDRELSTKFSDFTLRAMLSQFLSVWHEHSLDRRRLGIIDGSKFVNSWNELHTVTGKRIDDSQVVYTKSGATVQTRECSRRLRELRSELEELSQRVEACKSSSDIGCYTNQALALQDVVRAQKSFEPCS